MSADKPEDKGTAMTYVFATHTAEEMQRWVDAGYFKDHSAIAAIAFGMVHQAVQCLEHDKKVIDFDTVIIDINVNVPNAEEHPTLQ